jgi:hypothetical protein
MVAGVCDDPTSQTKRILRPSAKVAHHRRMDRSSFDARLVPYLLLSSFLARKSARVCYRFDGQRTVEENNVLENSRIIAEHKNLSVVVQVVGTIISFSD